MRKFAVFDIDGTLIRWQLYHAVVDRLAKNGHLGKDAKQKLHEARMVWKRREATNAFHAYEHALISLYEEALPTLKPATVSETIQEIAHEYKQQTYTYTRELALRLKKSGYILLAISGSHQEIVEQIARVYEFDDWVGTVYEVKDGRYTGIKSVGSLNKAETLQRLVKKHKLVYEGSVGVGDSQSDASFLRLVERPIAFNPDKALFELAQEENWEIIIERKNVVYDLIKHGENYELGETTF